MKCWEGCLALVVSGVATKNNIGKAVKCIKYKGTVFRFEGNDLWLVDQQIEWVNTYNGISGYHCYINDKHLMPLREDKHEEAREESQKKSSREVSRVP